MLRKHSFKKRVTIAISFSIGILSCSLSFGEGKSGSNIFNSVDPVLSGNIQENKQDMSTLFSDLFDTFEGLTLKYFDREKIRKILDKDSKHLKSLSDYLGKHDLEMSVNFNNSVGFRLNFKKKKMTDEFKANLIAKFGSDMAHGFLVRDVYDRLSKAIVGKVIYPRGQFEDGTFLAMANINKDGQKMVYFSDGINSKHVLD